MIIAINTRCLSQDLPGECGDYLNEILIRLIKFNPEHTFVLFLTHRVEREFNFAANVVTVVAGPKKITPAKLMIWYNIKIPRLLKKYKADVFLSPDLCSLTTKVPQCLFVYDLSFLLSPSFVRKSLLSFYKKYTPRALKRAKQVIVSSEFFKDVIARQYKIPHNKIQLTLSGVPGIYKPVAIIERELIKKKYAGGNEFFLYTGEITSRSNLMNLLKAFSAFKKRQKSGMQLLISSEKDAQYSEFITSLTSYKFREEVQLLTNLPSDENSRIIASSYAMVYVPYYENFGTSLLKAMNCEVPAITSSKGMMAEISADAALYASAENFKEIAVKMMLLFKDEKLRKDLIINGRKQVQKFDLDNAAKEIWDGIKKAFDNNN